MRRTIMVLTAALLMVLIMAMAAGLASARSCVGEDSSERGGIGEGVSTQAGPGYGERVSAIVQEAGSQRGNSGAAQQSCP
jgi:hypothetical protein